MNGVSHEVGHGVIMVLAVSCGVSWGQSWSRIVQSSETELTVSDQKEKSCQDS